MNFISVTYKKQKQSRDEDLLTGAEITQTAMITKASVGDGWLAKAGSPGVYCTRRRMLAGLGRSFPESAANGCFHAVLPPVSQLIYAWGRDEDSESGQFQGLHETI